MKCNGFSEPCGKYKAVRFRMNTAYVEDERNYKILCPKCQEESNEYWDDKWREYYANCM